MLWLPSTAAVAQSTSQAWDLVLTEEPPLTGMQSLFFFGSVDAGVSAVHLVPSEWKPLTFTAPFVVSTLGQSARHSMLRPTDLPSAAAVHGSLVLVLSSTQTPASTWHCVSLGSLQSASVVHSAAAASERNWSCRKRISGTGVTVVANESATA